MRSLAVCTAAAMLLAGCVTVPPAPTPPPLTASKAEYRAVGTEPFWNLELNHREMVFTEANAPGVRVAEPLPKVIHGFAGDIYNGRRIGLNIVRNTRCSDGMSDRIYPDRVQVRVDERSFEGCGGEVVMPAQLAGTSWTVESVNQRTTSGGDRFAMRFEADRLTGSLGCNRISGSYRFDGQTFNPGPVASTRMACPDMRFESDTLLILSQPAVTSWSAGDRLTLSNSAGTIVLWRVI